ncbi:hypothetical protein MD484_g65, partial [Candolleomyces efflorescens]
MAALTLARAYQHSFDTRPNVTLAITGGSLNALGDCVAQIAENTFSPPTQERRKYDFVRTVRFFAYGATISPFLGRWNAFLEARFPLYVTRIIRRRPNAAGGLVRPAQGPPPISYFALSKRVATDQLIMAPTGLVLFIGSMGMMEGRTRSQIKQKYKDLFGDAILANWKVWPLAQVSVITSSVFTSAKDVHFDTCGVLWTLYLSLLNSREDKKQDDRVVENKQVIFQTEVPYEQHTTHKGTKHVV